MQMRPALRSLAIFGLMLPGTMALHGQGGLVLSNIDTTGFPLVAAHVQVVDSFPRRDLTALRVKENGIERPIRRIDCPDPIPPRPISSVLTIDVSSSMQGAHLEIARKAAHFWVDRLPLGLSTCAVTSFSTQSRVHSDLSRDRNALHAAIDRLDGAGGTNYAAGLIDTLAGAIPLAARGSAKRIVVFLTDGQGVVDEEKVVAAARSSHVAVYCVAVGLSMPEVLRTIAERTGGAWFERVDASDRILEVYQAILRDAQGMAPCTVVWESDAECRRLRDVLLLDPERMDSSIASYVAPALSVPTLEVHPLSLEMGRLQAGDVATGTVDITATMSDIVVERFTASHPSLVLVDPLPLQLTRGEHHTLTIRHVGTGAPILFGDLLLEGTFCEPKRIYVRCTGTANPPVPLTLTHPNGGEMFNRGDTVEFRWSGLLPESPVRLEVSADAGRSWTLVADSAVGLVHRWRASMSGDSCLARVVARGDGPLDSVLVLRSHISGLRDIAFSPDGGMVATGGIDESLNVWDPIDGRLLRTIGDHLRGIYSVDFSPDGRRLLVGTGNMMAVVWDPGTPTLPIVLQGGSTIPSTARYHPDGAMIATAAFTKEVSFWNAGDGSLIESIEAHADRSFALGFSRDGRWLASGSYDSTALLWTLPSHRPLVRLVGHRGAVNAVAFSPDGTAIVTGSADSTIRFWSLPDGDSLRTWRVGSSVGALLFSNGGRTLTAGGSDGVVRCYDVPTGVVTRVLNGHDHDVTALALSADGRRLGSASFDNTARIWDLAAGAAAVDLSDGPWSIITPTLTVASIEFGEVPVGSSADSVVASWICNEGRLPVRIDTVAPADGDRSDFQVVRIDVGALLRPGECIPIELEFHPTEAGPRRCTIRASGGDWSVPGAASGLGGDLALEVADPIDFGRVLVGGATERTWGIVRNVIAGKVPQVAAVEINDGPPDEFTWSNDPRTPFDVVDTVMAAMSFAPTAPGRRVALATLYDSAGSVLGRARLTGEGYCNDEAAPISIAAITASPGSLVRLPVLFGGTLPQQPMGFVLRLRLHRSIFYPLSPDAEYTLGGDRLAEYRGTWTGSNDTIISIPLLIALGEQVHGSIAIDDFAWTSSCAPASLLLGGGVDLSELCNSGTTRLVRDVGRGEIISVMPNPMTTTATVDYRLTEEGPTRLEVFDLAGRHCQTLFDAFARPGRHSTTIAGDGLNPGSYFLRLTTPTETHEQRLLVR